MKKIKITSEQYNKILLNEKKARLAASDVIINESDIQQPELLEEGLKEVLLGVAMLMGVSLTAQNKAIADNALKNDSTMAQIKTTLEDENKTKELAKIFGEKGMQNPELKLAQNAEKIAKSYNEIATDNDIKYKVTDKVVTNLVALDRALGQGYALKKSEMSTDTIKGTSVNSIVIVKDTIEVELGNDNLFMTGDFNLNDNGRNLIDAMLKEIQAQGGKVLSAYIESSTDAESVPKFRNETDKTGNITLASLRTKAVSDLISGFDGDISISHREIPNNGLDVASTQDFNVVRKSEEDLKQLRNKTSEFRYVKIKLVAEFEQKVPNEKPKPEEIVKNYRFELVKVVTTKDTGKVVKLNGGPHFAKNKIKCKTKASPNIGVYQCSTFEG